MMTQPEQHTVVLASFKLQPSADDELTASSVAFIVTGTLLCFLAYR